MDALVDLDIAELEILMENQNQTPDSFVFNGDEGTFTPELFLSNSGTPYAPDADPFETEWLALQLAPDTLVSDADATKSDNVFTEEDDGGFNDPTQPPSSVNLFLASVGIYIDGDPANTCSLDPAAASYLNHLSTGRSVVDWYRAGAGGTLEPGSAESMEALLQDPIYQLQIWAINNPDWGGITLDLATIGAGGYFGAGIEGARAAIGLAILSGLAMGNP